MDWIFLAFSLAALLYTANIFKEFRVDQAYIETCQLFLENERIEIEEKVSVLEAEQADVHLKKNEIKTRYKDSQAKLARLMREIEHLRDEDERRGKFKVE